MMHTWFEAGIRHEDAEGKKVTEKYLVDALSFTEAEARIIEKQKPSITTGELEVVSLKRVKISEIFYSFSDADDKWYKCKVNFISRNDKGKEKKTAAYMLVQSSSTASAEKLLHENMKGTTTDYKIEAVMETSLMDIYPYVLDKETEETK